MLTVKVSDCGDPVLSTMTNVTITVEVKPAQPGRGLYPGGHQGMVLGRVCRVRGMSFQGCVGGMVWGRTWRIQVCPRAGLVRDAGQVGP